MIFTHFYPAQATLCMPFLLREIKALTRGHAVPEFMLFFSFSYMIEGSSGLGLPLALGAPIIVALGVPKYPAVVILLLMNTFATVWAAAGAPLRTGFATLRLSNEELVEVSYKAGVALAFAAYILLPLVLLLVCSWERFRLNAIFFFLSLTSCIGPSLALLFVAYEPPAC